jgi:hypothetical protein
VDADEVATLGLADLAWIGDEACATMPSIAVEVGRV